MVVLIGSDRLIWTLLGRVSEASVLSLHRFHRFMLKVSDVRLRRYCYCM